MSRKVNQIGIVVKDIEKAVEFYKDFLGIESFNIMERPPESCILHGEKSDFKLKSAFTSVEGLQIELIQVLEGRTLHTEFMEKHGEGLHHFGYYVDDLETELKKMEEQGIQVLSSGEFMGTKWAYLDTLNPSGAVQELIELPKPRKRKKKVKV